MSQPKPKSVAVLGASGNVGRQTVARLLASADVARVITINRRRLDGVFPDDARLESHEVDMSTPDALQTACDGLLHGVDVVVATMGLGSGRGSVELFRTVEVELPSAFARAAAAAGVSRAVLLTSAGADIENERSWLLPHVARGRYFYFKGLVEKNFTDAGFDSLVIFRPGGLSGTDHFPPWLDRVLPKLDVVLPRHFRHIHIESLAELIVRAALDPTNDEGRVTILEGDALRDRLL